MDELHFLEQIKKSPNDEFPRLVFADWLEERGDPRAKWVRDKEIWHYMKPDAANPIPRMLPLAQADRVSFDIDQRADAKLRDQVCDLLYRLGADVIMDVRNWLRNHQDQWPCRGLQEYVTTFPPNPLRSVADLRKAIQLPSWYDKWEAIIDLGFHGPQAAEALPELCDYGEYDCAEDMQDQLDPEDEPLPNAFFRTVGRIGPAAMEIAENLAEDLGFYETAQQAILLVRPDPSVVLEYMNDDSNEEAQLGMDIAASLAEDRVAFLVQCAREQEGRKQEAAIYLLGEMGSDAERAVYSLSDLLDHEGEWNSDTIRFLAEEAINRIKNNRLP